MFTLQCLSLLKLEHQNLICMFFRFSWENLPHAAVTKTTEINLLSQLASTVLWGPRSQPIFNCHLVVPRHGSSTVKKFTPGAMAMETIFFRPSRNEVCTAGWDGTAGRKARK